MDGPDSLLGFWLFFYLPNPHFSFNSLFFFFLSTNFPSVRGKSREPEEQEEEEEAAKIKFKKMLLGKRPRPPMKRTTSLSEINFDLDNNNCEAAAAAPPSDPQISHKHMATGFSGHHQDQRLLAAATISTRSTHRRASADFLETAHFLRSCSLCKRRLVSGRDIYMYRGDSAFCSLECRQQQMNQDERKEKGLLVSKKEAEVCTQDDRQ